MATKLNTATSIVDYLKSVGDDSSMAARKEIAKELGIKNYKGTAEQNIKMLSTLKNQTPAATKAEVKKEAEVKAEAKKTTAKAPASKAPTPVPAPTPTPLAGASNPTSVNGAPTTYASGNSGNLMYGNVPLESTTTQIQQLLNAVPELQNNYVRPDYTNVINPNLRSADNLAQQYGLDYNKENIQGVFNNAVNAEYDARYAQQDQIDGGYYRNLAATQNTALDTIRQTQNQAILSGASRGAQSANQLSAILGLTQQSEAQATELAQARGLLAQEEGAARAKSVQDALAYYDNMGTTLADLSKQLYSYDIQQQTAQLGYNQGINTDYAGVMAQQMAADAQRAAAISSGTSSILGNYNNAAGGIAQSNISADATRYNADQNAAATRYNADKNYSGAQYAANQGLLGSQAIANATKDAANNTMSYMDKVIAAAQNGASPTIVNNMISQGTASGAINPAGALHAGGYNNLGDYVLGEMGKAGGLTQNQTGANVKLPTPGSGQQGSFNGITPPKTTPVVNNKNVKKNNSSTVATNIMNSIN